MPAALLTRSVHEAVHLARGAVQCSHISRNRVILFDVGGKIDHLEGYT